MHKIRTIIIDDERSAREELKQSLAAFPAFECIAEARHADEAEQLINTLHPDLVLLDIQMPERTGFELLESLTTIPRVIFVTAFDQYALKAFEVSAIDYLLKPVREERLAKALNEAAQRIGKSKEPFVFIKEGNRYHLAKWSEVAMVESADPYVRVYINNEKPLLKTSLSQLETTLDPVCFFRANRWQLINLHFVKDMQNHNGVLLANMSNGKEVLFSGRQTSLFKKIQKKL